MLLSESTSDRTCAQISTVRQNNGLKECALAILFVLQNCCFVVNLGHTN